LPLLLPLTDDERQTIGPTVAAALAEDVGSGDLTAALIDEDAVVGATIIAREALVLAGHPWATEVFRQLDERIQVDWYVEDGQRADADDVICKLVGPARPLLTGERTALNFLQTLSGTATVTAEYVSAVAGTGARVLDTRKTLPGLRLAQKYAVRCGGGHNHRVGLFDAILIKENHVKSAGSITAALQRAQAATADVLVEVEVETLDELREAVAINSGYGFVGAELEASGNVSLATIRAIAETGVDYISAGAITKNVRAIDLSMLFRID
jgi:nicotinate-nucleotide pyrophosphorylase (carboxylating)